MPEGLERALSLDLSPLRPWEYAICDAGLWTEARELKAAFEQGQRDAAMEAAAAADTERWLRESDAAEAG